MREKEVTDYPTHLLKAEREELPNGPVVLENPHGVIADFSGNPPYKF